METSTTKKTPEEAALEKSLRNLMDLIMRMAPIKIQQRGHQILVMTGRTDSIVLGLGDLLWNRLKDTEIRVKKNLIEIKDLDKSSPKFSEDVLKLDCAEDSNSEDWIPLSSDDLQNGKPIDVQINGIDHPIVLHKKLIGVNLKKSEYEDISYRVKRVGSNIILSIKKYFPPISYRVKSQSVPLAGTEYNLVRSFLIA